MSNGVPQGLTSSPLLFNIFSLSLIDSLAKEGCKLLLYADDILGYTDSI